MVARESRATDREGGRDWMLEQIVAIGHGSSLSSIAAVSALADLSISESSVWRSRRMSEAGPISIFPAFFGSEFGVPAIMDNDANAGALGEAHFGAGLGYDPLFYMTLSTGIGGGIVHDGCVYRGADSYAGEIGHLTIRPMDPSAFAAPAAASSGCAAGCGWNRITVSPQRNCSRTRISWTAMSWIWHWD